MFFFPPISAKPKPARMSITSAPEGTLSPPRMHWLGNLEIGQDSRRAIEAERGRNIAFEIKGYGVTDIVLQLLKRRALGNDRSIHAAGGIDAILVRDLELHDRFHITTL